METEEKANCFDKVAQESVFFYNISIRTLWRFPQGGWKNRSIATFSLSLFFFKGYIPRAPRIWTTNNILKTVGEPRRVYLGAKRICKLEWKFSTSSLGSRQWSFRREKVSPGDSKFCPIGRSYTAECGCGYVVKINYRGRGGDVCYWPKLRFDIGSISEKIFTTLAKYQLILGWKSKAALLLHPKLFPLVPLSNTSNWTVYRSISSVPG